MNIVRRKLDGAEYISPNLRWIEATNTVEYSPDGGFTWYDDPYYDPRSAPAYRFARPDVTDPRCAVANGMLASVRFMVDERLRIANEVGLRTSVVGIAALIFKIPFIADLIIAVAGLLAELDTAALTSAFTEEGYADLLCVFYKYVDEEGFFSWGFIDDVIVEAGEIALIMATVVSIAALAYGSVGFDNSWVVNNTDDNCDDCGGWCYTWDLTASDGGFSLYGTGQGQYVSSSGWECRGLLLSGTNRMLCQITKSFTSTTLTRVAFGYDRTAGTQTAGAEALAIFVNGVKRAGLNQVRASETGAYFEWTGEITGATSVILTNQAAFGAQNGSGRIFGATMEGEGENPFGEDNC